MKLKENGIYDLDSWFDIAPPMGAKSQWVVGRSAMELARYMTAKFPYVPCEIEKILIDFTESDAEFDWAGEHITSFAEYDLGRGEGRNHDAFMWNGDVVVGIVFHWVTLLKKGKPTPLFRSVGVWVKQFLRGPGLRSSRRRRLPSGRGRTNRSPCPAQARCPPSPWPWMPWRR